MQEITSKTTKHKEVKTVDNEDYSKISPTSNEIAYVVDEFTQGAHKLLPIEPIVSIFGGARQSSDTTYYIMAKELASKLSKAGVNVATGGASGIMEAASCGAYEGSAKSIGLNIALDIPHQKPNDYQDVSLDFEHFFTRKFMFFKYSKAFVAFPGGYGTLDEVIEAISLVQCKKIEPMPIILVGKKFWSGLDTWFKQTLLKDMQAVSEKDVHLYKTVDSSQEAFEILEQHIIKKKDKII